MNNKSKPRELKPSIKRLIFYRAITQRKIPREFLANELIKEIDESGEIPPTLETAKRYISKARNSDNPIDEPWTLACCSQYSSFFPPDSIPVLVGYKQWFDDLFKESDDEYRKLFGLSPSDFSIRHSIWIIRLKPLIEKTFADLMVKDEQVRLGYPIMIAMFYALAEMASEIMGEDHFDSSHLDRALVAGDLSTFAKITGLMFLYASKPTKCDSNCESCKYQRLPGSTRFCMPKRKDGQK
jgi:hypothetical protein